MLEFSSDVTLHSLRKEQTRIEDEQLLDEMFLANREAIRKDRIYEARVALEEAEDYILSSADYDAMQTFTPAYGPAISLQDDNYRCESGQCGVCISGTYPSHIGASHLSRIDLDELVYMAQIKASRLLMQDVERLMN